MPATYNVDNVLFCFSKNDREGPGHTGTVLHPARTFFAKTACSLNFSWLVPGLFLGLSTLQDKDSLLFLLGEYVNKLKILVFDKF